MFQGCCKSVHFPPCRPGLHLVLCPTSLLVGPILCSKFQFRPLIPALCAPSVAADAKFVKLLFLGIWAFSS